MAEQNVLTGGIDVLHQIISDYKEHCENIDKNTRLQETVKNYKKEITALELAEKNEIETKVKDGIDSVVKGYDKILDEEKAQLKKIQTAREKAKTAGVRERINNETSELRTKNKELNQEIKQSFKQDKILNICNSRIFFAVFQPETIGDRIIYILGVLLIYLAIPCVMCKLNLFTRLSLVIYYFIIVMFNLTLYRYVFSKVMLEHRDIIIKARNAKSDIKSNKKEIKNIKNGIKSDKSEEMYDLREYDDKILDINEKIQKTEKSKIAAMEDFNKTVKKDIISEINKRNKAKKDNMLVQYESSKEECEELEQLIKEQRVYISTNYEAYISKEFMTLDMLKELEEIMSVGMADTISKAMDVYKNETKVK